MFSSRKMLTTCYYSASGPIFTQTHYYIQQQRDKTFTTTPDMRYSISRNDANHKKLKHEDNSYNIAFK